MHLLITRPQEEAEALRARLAARGIASTVAPMLEIELLPPATLDLDGVQALIATSRNGLKALALSPVRDTATALPIYVVGKGTAELAAEVGFKQITTGPGTARGLAPVIVADAKPGEGGLVQLAGDKLAFDLAGALARDGFITDVVNVYRSRPAQQLPECALAGLRDGEIDTVLLTSPLAARTFAALAVQAQLSEPCQRLVYICLSQEIAAELAKLDPGSVHVAAAPTTDATLMLIDRLTGAGGTPRD